MAAKARPVAGADTSTPTASRRLRKRLKKTIRALEAARSKRDRLGARILALEVLADELAAQVAQGAVRTSDAAGGEPLVSLGDGGTAAEGETPDAWSGDAEGDVPDRGDMPDGGEATVGGEAAEGGAAAEGGDVPEGGAAAAPSSDDVTTAAPARRSRRGRTSPDPAQTSG